MYDETFAAAGYERYRAKTPFYETECWIKTGSGVLGALANDINVNTLTGFWCAEHATNNEGYGRNEIALATYLTVTKSGGGYARP